MRQTQKVVHSPAKEIACNGGKSGSRMVWGTGWALFWFLFRYQSAWYSYERGTEKKGCLGQGAASQPACLGYDQVFFSYERAAPTIPPFTLEHSFGIEQEESLFPTAEAMCRAPDRAKATAWAATWGTLSTISSTNDLLLVFCGWLEKSWDEQNDSQFLIAEGISTTDFPRLTSHISSSSEGFQS